MKIGKRPIYKFCIDIDGNDSPIRCELDQGRTWFVISPGAAKATPILVVSRTIPGRDSDVAGRRLPTEGLFTVP